MILREINFNDLKVFKTFQVMTIYLDFPSN